MAINSRQIHGPKGRRRKDKVVRGRTTKRGSISRIGHESRRAWPSTQPTWGFEEGDRKRERERERERERWCLANWDARGIDQKTEALSCPSLVVGFAHSPLSVRSISQLGQIGGWILVPRLTRRNLSNSPQLDVQLRLFPFPPPIYIIFVRKKRE